MVQVIIAAALVWGLFKLLDKEGYLDSFTSLTFVLVPAVIVFFAGIAITSLGLSPWIVFLFELSYFLVPLLLLKAMTEYKWPRIIGYSAAVMVINVLTQAVAYVVLVAPRAP